MIKNYEEEVKEYETILYSEEGKDARNYLAQRGIKKSTALAWHLGFSPIGYEPKCYQGLMYSFYKQLNGRITIPIYNSNNELVSISGRSIYNEKPKYIHYQCPIRKLLFGLNMIEKEVFANDLLIFTEGQFDVITAWQNGFKNCACTFGAHFSIEQVIIASRYCSRIGILYDDDEAGKEGAKNSIKKIPSSLNMKIKNIGVFLKNGQDLDEWIKENDYNKILEYFQKDNIDWLKFKLNK